jgi:hypothetical protein
MPQWKAAPPQPVSHTQAIEAIRVMSSMAATIPPSFPPFEYGLNPGQFPMSESNSLPTFIVFLYLVTNPDFLDELDANPAKPVLVVPDDIAAATNLTVAQVNRILDIYRNADTDVVQPNFRAVGSQLQGFINTISIYPRTNCPQNGGTLQTLAINGAAVDPSARP